VKGTKKRNRRRYTSEKISTLFEGCKLGGFFNPPKAPWRKS